MFKALHQNPTKFSCELDKTSFPLEMEKQIEGLRVRFTSLTSAIPRSYKSNLRKSGRLSVVSGKIQATPKATHSIQGSGLGSPSRGALLHSSYRGFLDC